VLCKWRWWTHSFTKVSKLESRQLVVDSSLNGGDGMEVDTTGNDKRKRKQSDSELVIWLG